MIKVGIIGAGKFAEAHVKAIAAVPDVVLLAASRRDKEKLKIFCDSHRVKGFTDYKKLLKNQEIDAILIATPHHLHTKIALDAAKSGKHLMIEKPMATTVEECAQIIRAAEKSNVKLMVGQTLRFNPSSIYVADLVKTNQYGSIVMGTATMASLWNNADRKPWHLKLKSDGGILKTLGVHYIDLLNSLIASNVKSVYASMKSIFHSYEIDDAVTLLLRYKNGTEATIICAGYQQGSRKTVIEIYQENAIVKIDYDQGVFIKKDETQLLTFPMNFKKGMEQALFNQWVEFRNAITEDRTPSVSGKQGMHAVAVIEAAFKSSKLGCEIHLD